jgi:hypothetical protein
MTSAPPAESTRLLVFDPGQQVGACVLSYLCQDGGSPWSHLELQLLHGIELGKRALSHYLRVAFELSRLLICYQGEIGDFVALRDDI